MSSSNNIQLKGGDLTFKNGATETCKVTTQDGNLHVSKGVKATQYVSTDNIPTSTETMQVATTKFVQARIQEVIGAAPAALDTLKEISEAINGDEKFSETITNLTTANANAITAVQSDIDVNETRAKAAEAAEVSARTVAIAAVTNILMIIIKNRVVTQNKLKRKL